MKKTSVQGVAKLLRTLVYIVLAINILCMPAVPYFTLMSAFFGGWTEISYWVVLMLFFWVCGSCTAVILWQARKILDNILAGETFCMENAVSMNRAAACCWIISGAALVRFVIETAMLRSFATFFTYNTLFIPAFFMAGLLFRVMAALFRQAAELQEDQDLTI